MNQTETFAMVIFIYLQVVTIAHTTIDKLLLFKDTSKLQQSVRLPIPIQLLFLEISKQDYHHSQVS